MIDRDEKCKLSNDVGPRTVTPRELVPRTKTPTTPMAPLGGRTQTSNAGILAVGAWLVARGLYPPTGGRWGAEISLDGKTAASAQPRSFYTRFEITIVPSSWGFKFWHGDRTSTVRVTDIPQARDRDEHHLVMATPALKNLGTLLRTLEQRYQVYFGRHLATIRTDIAGGEPIIRAWVASL